MKIYTYEDKDAWFAGRRKRITSSRLKDVVVKRGTGKKIGYYELIAERLGLPADDESPMDRGTRLESEALDRFEVETGLNVNRDLAIWTRDDNENIAVSPDGYENVEKPTWAAECKCLASARHIEAFLTQGIPDDYKEQAIQYFIVNDDLQKLYFVFYDPRLIAKDFFFIEINRKDIEEDIAFYLDYQRKILEEVEADVLKITGF